ncbi:hypothetical protein WISP_28394 [Willisornis vidua]|uniref:Uncharacterized protein n=1 Tax=Willisornis vidua TaxID=1566151 RepID=A0ABQ9DKZ2_9PASS|nr:hypothetical protein WISP_28394 [Willisornis vidua]
MSDGESREPPRPAGGDVRVPIPAPPRRPAEPPPGDANTGSGCGSSPAGSPGRDPPPDLASEEEEEQVPYPALAPTAFFCLKQTTRPRSWCLRLGDRKAQLGKIRALPALDLFVLLSCQLSSKCLKSIPALWDELVAQQLYLKDGFKPPAHHKNEEPHLRWCFLAASDLS